jgi:3'-phosphoadenosine 5'-phosphosulfate sulfotransferase (PAPS reductase)/FAD synthetase
MKVTARALAQRQTLPLTAKVQFAKNRIREFYEKCDGNVNVSFSGGKDSTVLVDIIREMYPDVPLVFCDTGLEYPEIKNFVKKITNVTTIKPSVNFKQVIEHYGYPVVSKEVALKINHGRKAFERGDVRLYEDYILGQRKNKRTGRNYTFNPLPKCWLPLYHSDIKVSEACCDIMKKSPFKKLRRKTKAGSYIGIMASDSMRRKEEYIKLGCNTYDQQKGNKSRPLAIWTEQDVLQHIYERNLPIAECYGNVILNDDHTYQTTGVKRTGCMFCAFGAHLEAFPNRFQQMKLTHPAIWDYCIRDTELGGLGFGKVLDFIGVEYE